MDKVGETMLYKFTTKNFKGFKDEIEFNFKANDYQFNKEIIKNNIIKKALIYGKNAEGKTNLGLAIFDMVFHLTDYDHNMIRYYENYLNLDSKEKEAYFKYEFKYDDGILIYEYKKTNVFELTYEKVTYNDEIIVEYNFKKPKSKIINIEGTETLNWKYNNEKLSIVKYITNNTKLDDNNPLNKLMTFVHGMLLFRDNEGNSFIGLKNTVNTLDDLIISNNELKNFEQFLKDHGINYTLTQINDGDIKRIGVKFKNGVASFNSVASTGTKSLRLFYCWKMNFKKVKFLFIDEFDSNYHFELSSEIVQLLNELDVQIILTTHNTYLMSNKLTRPDCTFILSNGKITSLANSTGKELREAHNIEKLYREGHFID